MGCVDGVMRTTGTSCMFTARIFRVVEMSSILPSTLLPGGYLGVSKCSV